MHKSLFYNKFISCFYMFRAHVLIITRSKLHYTASGIITPIGGRLVHRLREYSTISLFHASTCFEHMCSSSGVQNCITQPLVSSYLKRLFYNKFISCLCMFGAHVFVIRRSKLHYTASGIITLKQVSGLKLLKYNSVNMNKL